MATEEIITKYTAQVEGYISELNKIEKELRDVIKLEKQQATDAEINSRELKTSAAQRNKLLQDEIKNLAQLKAASQKAFTVPEIKDFNNRIAESQKNISLLKGEQKSIGNLTSGLKNQFLGLGAGIAAAFTVGAVVNFGKESVRAFQEAEKSAKLLESAIKNVAGGDDSAVVKFLNQAKELQKTTIFNDEQIQAAQTLAFQFGLTQEQVESLIPTIVDFASATGQDLQTALESVLRATEGQGRGLKVYGVSIKDTADRSKDLANITEQLNQKFKDQGEVIGNTASGKIAKFNNQLDEIKEKVGGFITRNALAPVVDVLSGLVNAIGGLGDSDLDILTDAFDRQAKVTKDLTENISPLIDRYDELKSQSTLNVDEQKELESIILKVGDALPGSISGFDEYGKAIGISTSAAREAIQAQKDLTVSLNQKKITETQKEFDRLSLQLKTLVADLNSGTTSIQGFNNTLAGVGATATKVKLSPTDIADFQKQASELTARVRGLGLELKVLKGEPLVIAPAAKVQEDINNLQKLKDKLKSLQDDLEKLPLTKLGAAIDPAEQARLVKAITDTQKLIDDITGKSAEEAKKKAEERRKELLSAEKKLHDDINKLRLDLAPTPEEKVKIQFEIDKSGLSEAKEDFRSTAEIIKSIDSEKTNFLKLNALKLLSDLKAIDEQRLNDIRKNFEDELAIKNKERTDQADRQTKDAQDRLKKQFDAEDELQDVLNQKRLKQFADGSIEQLNVQKQILEENAAQEILANQNNATKILAIREKLSLDLADITAQQNQIQLQNTQEMFDAIAGAAVQLFSTLNQLSNANLQNRIADLEDERDSQISAIDAQQSNLEENRNKDLISQRTYEKQSEVLKNQRIATEKRINDAIKAEKRKAAEREKALAIFEATLNFYKAILVATSAAPPPFNAVLAAISAALAGVQLAATIATPLPAFKHGTKSKQSSGLAIVGEEGEEIVNLPSGAQVLPHRQTVKHRRIINSMFDNTFEDLIHTDYVIPEIIEHEKNIVQREKVKHESQINKLKTSLTNIIENISEKKFKNVSEVENLSLTKENKTDIINRVNEITLITDGKQITSKIKSLKIFTDKIIQDQQNEFSKSVIEKNTMIRYAENVFIENNKKFNEKVKSLTANINKEFSYRFSEPFISKILLTQKQESENKKQENFAENIAKAIVVNGKNEIKSDAMTMWDYVHVHNSTKLKHSKERDYRTLAKFIAEELRENK